MHTPKGLLQRCPFQGLLHVGATTSRRFYPRLLTLRNIQPGVYVLQVPQAYGQLVPQEFAARLIHTRDHNISPPCITVWSKPWSTPRSLPESTPRTLRLRPESRLRPGPRLRPGSRLRPETRLRPGARSKTRKPLGSFAQGWDNYNYNHSDIG